jgi:hypothetical protein
VNGRHGSLATPARAGALVRLAHKSAVKQPVSIFSQIFGCFERDEDSENIDDLFESRITAPLVRSLSQAIAEIAI